MIGRFVPEFTPADRLKAETLAAAIGREALDDVKRNGRRGAAIRLRFLVTRLGVVADFLAVGDDAERADAEEVRKLAGALHDMADSLDARANA